jgi:lysophospholipase L1-like esterase
MNRPFRFLAVFLALFASSQAAAQSWTVGEVEPEWQSSTAWVPPIPPDSAHPADAYEPAVDDQDGYTRSLWISSTNDRDDIGLPGGDGKFRTVCHATFTKRADPILTRGQYPAGHDHTFIGPIDPYVIENVEDFDYQMGRDYPGSACDGGPLNTTLYWEPSVKDARHGLKLTVIPSIVNFYYTHSGADGPETTRLRRNYRFIGGTNPSDYNDTAVRAEHTAAGLLYPGSPDTPAGFGGIQCFVGGVGQTVVGDARLRYDHGGYHTTEARYLKGPNGEDPWNGACTAGEIVVLVNAQDCWDGTNLSSPNGRQHVRYSTRAGDNDPPDGQCPDNYVKVLHFETKVHFEHNGWEEDLQYWYMSSDRMNSPGTPGDPTSLDPCRQTGPWFCSFSTAHFDWWGSWDDTVLELWERNCGGLTIDGITTNYADCGTSAIDDNATLKYGTTPPPEAGLSTDPVRSLDVVTASNSTEGLRYFAVNPDDENQDALHLHGPFVIVHEGDSISDDFVGYFAGYFENQHPELDYTNLSVGGSGISTLLARRDAVLALEPDLFTVFIGANDLGAAATAQDFVDDLLDYIAPIRAQGAKVLVGTNLPIYLSGNPTYTAAHNALTDPVADLLNAQVGVTIDGVFDFEASPVMGPAAAAQDTDLYSDGVHPTGRNGTDGGHDYLYTIYRNAITPFLP